VDDEIAVRARPSTSARSFESPPAVAPGRKRRRRAVRRDGYGAVFISPFVLALTLFMLVPIGYAVYQSLYTTKLIGGTSYSGLANYHEVLTSAQF